MNIYDTNESDVTVLSYGGGVQSVAMCVLAATGRLPSPDHIVFADTGREIPSTLEDRATGMDPYLERYGMRVETAGHDLATVDLYAHNGDLLLPRCSPTPGNCVHGVRMNGRHRSASVTYAGWGSPGRQPGSGSRSTSAAG